MKTVICRLDLGQTRIAGYTLYDDITKQFNETTPKEVLNLVRANKVQGLKVVKKVELNQDNYYIEPDLENFNQFELMIKSAVGKFRTLNGSDIDNMYAVTKHYVVEGTTEQYFEVISNQCSRIVVTQDVVEAMAKIVAISGIRIKQSNDENGQPEELFEILCGSETVKSSELNTKTTNLVVYELGAILSEMIRRKNDLDKADKIRKLIEETNAQKEICNGNTTSTITVDAVDDIRASVNDVSTDGSVGDADSFSDDSVQVKGEGLETAETMDDLFANISSDSPVQVENIFNEEKSTMKNDNSTLKRRNRAKKHEKQM